MPRAEYANSTLYSKAEWRHGLQLVSVRDTLIEGADASESIAHLIYRGKKAVSERHRHRYEVNIDRVSALEAVGLKYTGRDETGERMEVLELEGHPFPAGAAGELELGLGLRWR